MCLIIQQVIQTCSHGGCQSVQRSAGVHKASWGLHLDLSQCHLLYILWPIQRERGECVAVFANYTHGNQGLQEQRNFTRNCNEEEESYLLPALLIPPWDCFALRFTFLLSLSLYHLVLYFWCVLYACFTLSLLESSFLSSLCTDVKCVYPSVNTMSSYSASGGIRKRYPFLSQTHLAKEAQAGFQAMLFHRVKPANSFSGALVLTWFQISMCLLTLSVIRDWLQRENLIVSSFKYLFLAQLFGAHRVARGILGPTTYPGRGH